MLEYLLHLSETFKSKSTLPPATFSVPQYEAFSTLIEARRKAGSMAKSNILPFMVTVDLKCEVGMMIDL